MLFPTRQALEAYQLERLNRLLAEVLPQNAFFRQKFAGFPGKLTSLDEWRRFPLTTKYELSCQASPSGVAPHHTYPLDAYIRLHRTSGSTGRPLIVLDRREDWKWWLSTWQEILDWAEIPAGTVVFMAFSFGPFIGFWSANDACLERGCRVVPGGGLSTAARLDLIQATQPEVLFCTPSYAIHLAEQAVSRGLDPASLGIRKVFVAGEAGGSVATIREKIEASFRARVVDHAGATEIGPWGIGTADGNSLQILESEFIAEFIPYEQEPCPLIPESAAAASASPLQELVLTCLGRAGAPALRYRTGDLVRPYLDHPLSGAYLQLHGGVLGRTDQMMIIRGVNVIPSSVEAILHSIPGIVEYRLVARRRGAMDQLIIEVEDRQHEVARVVDLVDRRLGLRVEVVEVPEGTLPRATDKAKRFVDQRQLDKR